MNEFKFADLHCHPNLKPFGHSFIKKVNEKSCLWYKKAPTFLSKVILRILGVTRFSQTDFSTMSKSKMKIAFVSLYPFEKGFFATRFLPNKIAAKLSDFVTSIGYERVRYLQRHKNYFEDFLNEYYYLFNGLRSKQIDDDNYSWNFATNFNEIQNNLEETNSIAVIPTIEGAHIFNTGLGEFGVCYDETRILQNVRIVKNLPIPPLFITFAHNFNNDLCGHAPSLESIGFLVDQTKNLNTGFSQLGYNVLKALLSRNGGQQILIDIKHMSLKSRLQYYDILKNEYNNEIPIIASHGAVTGVNLKGYAKGSLNSEFFVNDSINFYDEEIVTIAKSNGLLGVQLDSKRLAPKGVLKKSWLRNNHKNNLEHSSLIIWRQLRHVAEILDAHSLPAWDICCIGSDFDGTIKPLSGIWTSEDFEAMAQSLVKIAGKYLKIDNQLQLEVNRNISPDRLVRNFTINNTINFLKHVNYGNNKDKIKFQFDVSDTANVT
jgi:microsomal dipeptidase-like Zn-dependent dipeptidase